ncbi:MAG: hypothetical protein ABI472_18100 [Ginsengibacter sp.]
MKETVRNFVPVIALFVFINILVFIFKNFLLLHDVDIEFLLAANMILFLLCFSGFFLQMKAMKSSNMNAFIRGVYSSLLLKIFIVIFALGLYLFLVRGKVNKPALFTSMGLYIVYTGLEVAQLMKISRKKPNA